MLHPIFLVALKVPELDELNQAAPQLMRSLVLKYTELGADIRKKNAVSGGAAKLQQVTLKATSDSGLVFDCQVQRRPFFGKPQVFDEETEASWSSLPAGESVRERLGKLACVLGPSDEACNLVDKIDMPTNLWLNNVPHSRGTREFFEDSVARAVLKAVETPGRYLIEVKPPELDYELDTYRVGTMLEVIRTTVLALAPLRVKVCVQAAMGLGTFQGIPISLNGVRRILEMMDWPVRPRFGDISEGAVDDSDVFILLAPQSIVGASIIDKMQEMQLQNQSMILFNPRLQDVASPQGIMSTKGRKQRLEYAATFEPIYYYRTLVPSTSAFFPILGAVMRQGPDEPYVLYKRTETQGDFADASARAQAVRDGDLTEIYVPIAAFATEPDSSQVGPLVRASFRSS